MDLHGKITRMGEYSRYIFHSILRLFIIPSVDTLRRVKDTCNSQMADSDKDEFYNYELSMQHLPVSALNQLMHRLIDDAINDLNNMSVKVASHPDNTPKAKHP